MHVYMCICVYIYIYICRYVLLVCDSELVCCVVYPSRAQGSEPPKNG